MSENTQTSAIDGTETTDSTLIYGQFSLGQTYDALPPAPDGYETRSVSKSDGSQGMKYVAAGTPRTRSGSSRFNGRGVFARVTETKGPKGSTNARFSLSAPINHGEETVVFNRASVPSLITDIQLGPKSVNAPKGQSPWFSGDNMLVSCVVAAREQAVSFSKIAAEKTSNEYAGKGFFKADAKLEDILENPGLIEGVLEYASPGGAGFQSRVDYFANDDSAYGTSEATGRLSKVKAWITSGASELGYDPQTIINQIEAHISVLKSASLPIPGELVAMMNEVMN